MVLDLEQVQGRSQTVAASSRSTAGSQWAVCSRAKVTHTAAGAIERSLVVPNLLARSAAHRCRARCTISTKTFLVSVGLLTSCKKAIRAPRIPSVVLRRT